MHEERIGSLRSIGGVGSQREVKAMGRVGGKGNAIGAPGGKGMGKGKDGVIDEETKRQAKSLCNKEMVMTKRSVNYLMTLWDC